MRFCERLTQLRISRNLTQSGLADATGLTKSALSNYEQGTREPKFEVLELLADFFNVDLNYLLGRESVSGYLLNPETDGRLVDIFRTLSETDKQKVLEYAEMLSKYK